MTWATWLDALTCLAAGRATDLEERIALVIMQEMPITLSALPFWREQDNEVAIAECLYGLAALAGEKHIYRQIKVYAASGRLFAIGKSEPLTLYQRREFNALVEACKSKRTPEEFAEAWRDGQSLILDEAVELAYSLT